MASRHVALCALALNLFSIGQASAFNQERMHRILNKPMNVGSALDHGHGVSGHNGFSIDVDMARGADPGTYSPQSSNHETTVFRYTIAFNAPETPDKACELSWRQTARVAATAVVWSLSNRLLRGEDDYGGQLPGGATLWGHTVPWLFAATIHDGLSYKQAAGHIAADFAAEQIGGWAESLDMGKSSELHEDHWAYNPGNRWQDQLGMTAKLYRAKSLSLAMLKHRYGDVSDVALASPAIGGAGYQIGRYLIDEGVTPDYEEKGIWANLVGGQQYHVGELVMGFGYGTGVARTVECS